MASLKELYTALKADGAPLPDTYEKFSNYMTSGPQDGYAHRKEVYDALKADGAPLPDTYEEFSRALFSTNVGINASSDSASARTGRDEGAETVQSFRLRRGGKDFSIPVEEVNAAGGLQGWAKAHPGAPVRVYMQGKNDDGSDFKGHVDLIQAHERNRMKGYKYQTVEAERFKPTELEKKRMSANLYRSMQQHNAAMQSIKDEQKDVMEYAAKGNGMNFGQAVKSTPQMNPETGEMEDTWLTPDGKRTMSKAAADLESFNYRMATDMSIGGQLRRANERLANIEKRLGERGKELMAEHDKNRPKGLAGFIKEAGQMVIADKVGGAPMQNPEEYVEFTQDKEYQSLRLAMRKAREEIQKLQNAKERETHGERFWHDFGRATGQAIANADAWDFGMGQLRDATTMMQLNKAVESGKELSKAENDALTELYLHDNVMNLYGDLGRGDRWGDIAGTSLSFMKDFILTGGGFSAIGTKIPTLLTKKVAFNMAKKMGTDMAGKKLALEIAENGVLNYIRKGGKGAIVRMLQSQGKAGLAATMATKAMGVGAEDLLIRAPLMAATIQGQSTAAKIIDTKLGPVTVDENSGELHFANDKSWGEAAWQAGADQVIENYSERWGAHIPAMSDVGKFFGARNLTAAVLRATRENAGTVLSKTNKFLTRAGVNGYLGEVGEEYYGQLWRTMLDLDSAKDSEGNNQFGSRQFHGDIWGGMALSIGMTSAGTVAGSYGVQGAQQGVNSAIYLHHKKNMQRSAKKAASVFDADEWESLQQLIDSQENATMGAFAETVLADPDMTQQQKDATMDYMEKAMTFRGYNLGEMLRGKSGENNPDEQELSQSYMDGYEGTSIQEMVDAANMYQLQYQKLMEAFDGMDEENLNRIMKDIHSDPIAAISKTGEELRPLMLDYANALMVYKGMEQRFNDDMESRIAQAEWETDANTNRQTGQIQPAVMETDGREVYVVNGQIAMLENGNIDTANSDDTIIIRDAETGKLEFANPKVLSSMGESQDPTALKEQQSAAIRQQLEQEHSDKMNGRLSLEAGSTVSVQRGDGMMSATITGPAIDEQGQPVEGAVTVQTEDGTVESYSVENLQAWADEANRQRVQDFENERAAQRDAEDASQSEDENASQPVMAMPPFALNDEFTILNPETGEPIHGEVTGELDEDGTVEIYTHVPMNGSLVNKIRPEELTGMIDTYNGERLEDMSAETPSASDSEQMGSEGDTEVYSIPAVGSGKGTDTTEVISGQSKGATAPAGNSSETSDGKVNNSASEKQENQGESSSASPTPLQRLPRDEKGEPIFEQAETPELGWDALVEARGGDVSKAQVVADMMAEIKRKVYEKLQKQKPKGSTPSEIIASQDAIDAELAQAELEYKQWQDIANVERVRQATIQAEQEAAEREAAELAAAEEAERKALEKADKRFGEVYDKVKGNALAVERLRQLEPETIYEAASVVLSRGKILWDNKGGSRGFKQETGYGEGERKKMFSMFATKENGGRSLRRLAEDEMQETCALAGIPYDNVDAFNALTEVISEAQLPSDIRNYIKNRRIEQALEIYDHEQAAERAAYEEWCYQNFSMSAEEYEAYEEQREEEIRNALGNFDENEYFSNIADELIERANERRRIEEADAQGESAGDVGGSEVLSTQGPDTQGGRSADADRQGVPEGNGDQVVDTAGAVPEGASGGEGVNSQSNNGTSSWSNDSIPNDVEVSNSERAEMEARIVDWLSDENLAKASGKTRAEIFDEFGNELMPIAYVPTQYMSLVSRDLKDPRIYCGKGYFIDHALRNHGASGTQTAVEDVDVSKYLNIQTVLDNPDSVKETNVDGKRTVVFIKKIGRYFAELTQVEEDGKIILHKSLFNQKKEPYAKLNDIRQKDASSEGGASSISHAEQAAPAISLESRDDALSDGKDNTLLSDKQEVERESSGNGAKASPLNETAPRGTVAPKQAQSGIESELRTSTTVQQAVEAASAEVNTDPTPAQAEAGNYKKGHVTIGEFDITIENPAGSVRKGVDANGKEWHTTMANAYGYIKGTEGVDGDHIDVFLHSDMDQWNGRKVFVVDQTNTDGSFDEHKVMLGFNDKDEAMTAYLANYDKTWADTHPGVCISETNIENFNKWIESSHRKTKPFAEYSTVSKVVDNAPVRSVHTQDNNKEIIGRSFSPEESVRFLNYMEETADVAPEIELTPANWTKEFGAHGIINTPIGEVKQGDNQYFKLAQKGRNGKLGMIRPTLEHPCVIIEDEREDHDGSHERFSSYIFIKTFAKKDGTRYYHFASITVSKEGKEVVISSQERSANRISKLLQQGKVAWINKEFSLHPMPQIEESVPLNDSNGPTTTDNQSAMLGVSSSELDVSSERKVNNSAPEKQGVERESSENEAKASTLNGTAPHGDKGNAKGKKAPRAGGGKEKVQDQTGRIEDFGEKIAGARKDLLHDMARSIENVTVQSLIELPLSKAFKRPNLKKMSEAGIISDDEALLAEAILQGLIYAKNKPAAARTSRRKREIEEWAKETYTGIRFLGEVLSGDAARKEQALASRKAEMERKVAETNAHIDNLREWNPGKTFDYVTSIPDEVEVLKRVLEGIGHRPGDRVELPLTRVELGRDTKTYTVDSAGKQGAKWFRKYHDSLDSAIDTMILAARLARGDMDVELPQNYMTVRGVGQPHKERTGKYEVLYWSKNGRTVNTKEFSDKQEAEAFAKANSGHVREQVRYINEYDGYMAYAINPLTGNKLPIGREFADRSELQAWIDEQRDEVNALAVEAIAKESATKGAPREHYYVVASWNKGKMIFSVVDNDKKNPWPIVKDFTTRKEAEQWLEENKERLEAERKMRLEKQKSVVYFNTASERKGADYRDSQPASPGIYDEKFGFRGVQFGNWTNAEDRQMAMDQAYDAFMDLSRQLGLDTRSMSLNGELALAFGARGGGSAAAHYEPMEVVINLTKTQGAGSLAHEWWHALDNFLSRKAGVSLGHATHGNGAENMDPEVSGAISSLAKAVENSEYGKRSTKMGDYWGRHTEMCARLFETWISERIKEQGESSPFLASGLNDNARIVYQKINYFAYRSNERRAAALENREPSVMSEEEFFKTPQSLNGYPYPTVEELKEFAPYLERLFEVLASKERAGGTIAEEPRRRYGGRKQPTVTGRSLFDWADDEEKARRVSDTEPMQATDKGTIDASREADEALDRYAEAYNDYLDRAAAMDSQLETEGVEEELRSDMMAQLEAEETMLYEQKERLEDTLRRFYALNNTPEDAERIARDMVCRMEAEVATQHNRNQILKDILDNAGETTDVKESAGVSDAAVSETEPVKSSVKTGGGYISYEAVGHLPNPLQGEFAYVERLFSRTGEFSFTGRDRIKDRGDVAYLFRNLESYAIENVFAVLVKDGKPTVLHVGMGTATSSMADMMAIRAGVDAFGADKIYLVHNHPSGTMQASIPDRNLMKVLEAAFEGKVSTEGIIIDTTSGRYVTFDGSGNTDVYDRPKSVDADARGANSETAPEVLRLDRTDQSRMPENVTTIRGAQDVKNYLERLRFGDGTKISYLILSHANQVIGNFHTNYTGIDETGLAEEITGMAIKYGGTNVVVYGNMPLAGTGQLQDGIRKHSLGKIALLDVMGVRNGNRESANDSGMMADEGAEYNHVSEPMVAGRSRKDFDAMQARAVRERGIVMPGLNEAEVRVVDVPRHDFTGTGKQALQTAEKWAKENIVGTHIATDNLGAEFEYSISNDAVEKYVSRTATAKSDNIGVHLAALKWLPEIISESIEAEVHPDYKKKGGIRKVQNDVNPESLVHRFYGAVKIDGDLYRVKITLREYGDKNRTPLAHTYEVTQIELLKAPSDGANTDSGEPLAMTSNNSISVAKLLNGVEKSYDPGKKLLDESAKDGMELDYNDDEDVLCRPVTDKATLERLNRERTVKVYRAMQMIDGGLRPPMSARVNGELRDATEPGTWEEAEERPELADDNGRFVLNKGNGKAIKAAYNPYIHTSRSPINDQFSSAWSRPELVTVEVEVPETELTGGYKADKAKDSVGEKSWKSGPVGRALAKIGQARRVILSRWDKVVRVVPVDEVAREYAKILNPHGIAVPFNIVPPALRDALVRQGVRIGAPEKGNAGAASMDAYNKWLSAQEGSEAQYRMGSDRFSTERREQETKDKETRKAARIQELSDRLHLDNVEVVTDTTQLEGKRAIAKGFYNKRTGKITIVLPNNASTIDAEQTLLHEAVAHYGLRQLFGDRFDTFLDNVFESAEPEIRRKIASMAREHGWNIRTATEEYLAGLAEDTDFEVAKEHAGWWTRIKRLFIDMVEKLGFRGFRDKNGTVLTDNELRYILWRSYENLKERGARGVMGEAADIAMQAELQVGNYAERGIEAEYATMPEDGIADKIEESFNAAVLGELRGKPIEIGVLTKEGRDYLEKLSGMKMKERVSFVLNPSDLVHIYRDHFGNNEKDKGNNIPLTIEDIRSIVDVVANPERIIFGKEPDGLKRNLFYFLAPAKEGTYNLLEIYGDRKGNLTAKTFYKTKKGVSQRVLSLLKSEHLTSVTDGSTLSGAKLPKFFENPTIEEEELFRPGDFTPRDKVLARDQYEKMVSRSRYQFTEAMQDSMLGLKELYRAISGKGKDFRIEDVAGFENAYLYENAMSSRNNSHAHRYFLSYMQPLLKEIGKICGANEQKRRDLTDYMMAKHGLERNEYMRNEAINNGENPDRDFAGLTGLTNEKDWQTAEAVARQWVDDYEAANDTTALWNAVNNATKATLWTVYQSGMINRETHDKIAGMYAYYIPLRGWDETTSDEVYGYLTSKDGPLNGSIMKSAEGRGSKADDPIATIAKMADDAIRQGHRNIMKQRVLNFVLNHPSDLVSVHDLWLEHDDVTDEWRPVFADINDTDTPAEVEQKIEAFETRMEALRTTQPDKYKRGRETQGIPYKVVKGNLREHQVLVKRNGQTIVLTINGNPRAAQAINGLTNPDVETGGVIGTLLKSVEWVNRQLSAFYTTRNPDFVVGNFMRDMLYSNCMMWVKESPRYARQFHKNFARVNPVTMRILLGKWENGTLDTSIPLELKFEQFMLNGGETGYTNVKDIEGYKRTVLAELKKQGSTARQKWSLLGMQLDLLNRSAENCARFAAFVTSREFGRSIDRSIYDAKEVSVNFNKKGSGGKMLNAVGQTKLGKFGSYLGGAGRLLWVFWGAGIQGMTNIGRAAKRNPKKFIAGATAMLALGAIIPMLAQMLWGGDGDDDDKNAYYNLPEYVRRSNICLKAGSQWITIPLPIEFRAIYGLGELGYGVISGNERYSNEELAYQTAAQVSQVLPLDMLEGGGGFQALIPSAFKPLIEAQMNQGWTGMPIYRDTPFNQKDPEWTKAYASADKHFVGASKWLNEVSGGDDFKKGAIDINPAKVEYMLNGMFGGMFTFPMKLKKAAETAFGDRDFEWRNMPIANRVLKSGDERTANRKLREEYFKYLDEYESTGWLMRKYENATDEGILGYAEKLNFLYNSPKYARWLVFDDFKADMDAYKEMMSDETDPAKQKRIKAEMETEMRELVNALHNPDKYLESIYGKGGYPGIAEEETETE